MNERSSRFNKKKNQMVCSVLLTLSMLFFVKTLLPLNKTHFLKLIFFTKKSWWKNYVKCCRFSWRETFAPIIHQLRLRHPYFIPCRKVCFEIIGNIFGDAATFNFVKIDVWKFLRFPGGMECNVRTNKIQTVMLHLVKILFDNKSFWIHVIQELHLTKQSKSILQHACISRKTTIMFWNDLYFYKGVNVKISLFTKFQFQFCSFYI